ncbi:MAG: hypothetical protein ACRYFU_20960 [Janthinobacterium lividum]
MPSIPSQILPPRFPAVPTQEIAFAMAVFLNAGNGTVSSRLQSPPTASAEKARDQIYLDLLPQVPAQAQAPKPEESSLHKAFSVVWEQFEGHHQQGAVCARLLAFHFLMERTRGQVVADWLRPCPDNPATVILDDAVVAALGTAPLRADGRLLEAEFISAVIAHFQQRGPGLPGVWGPLLDPRRVADQLLAHEAEISGVSEGELAVAVRICERLRHPLGAIVGREAFRTLVTRALALGKREDEALAALRVKEDGLLEGTGVASSQAATTLVAHLIRVPKILVGDAVTQNLLREAWPEISVAGAPKDQGGVTSCPS